MQSLLDGGKHADFFAIYAAGRQFLARGGDDFYNLATQKAFQDQVTAAWGGADIVLPYAHPPYEVLLIAPLALLPYPVAYAVMMAVNVALIAIAAAVLARANGLTTLAQAALAGLLLAGYLPLFVTLLQGQVDGLLLLVLAGSYAAWSARRDGTAGALAALALLKPHLMVLIPLLFLVRRSWRALGGFAAVAAVLALLSLLTFGIASLRDYAAIVLPWLAGGQANWPISGQSLYSLRGFIDMLPISSGLGLAVLALLDLAVVVLLALRAEDRQADFALVVAASLALSPYQNLHDLLLLAVPAYWLARRGSAGAIAVAAVAITIDLTLTLGPMAAALAVVGLAGYTSTKSRFRQAR